MDITATLSAMEVNAPATVKITGEDRDCALSSLYMTKERIEANTNKRFKISTYEKGTLAEITRIQ